MKRITLTTAAIIIAANLAFGQGTAINKTGATAHSSAMLDVSDTTKGILIPRMTKVNKLAISSPATGLMVYQTDDTTGFWYYSGAKWMQVSGSAGAGSTCSETIIMEASVNLGSSTFFIGHSTLNNPLEYVEIPLSASGTLSEMRVKAYCKTEGSDIVFTCVKNGIDQPALQVTLPGSLGHIGGNDLTGSVSFNAGDLLCVKIFVSSGTFNAFRITFKYQ